MTSTFWAAVVLALLISGGRFVNSTTPNNCIALNTVLPSSGVAVNASCTNVTYVDVTASPQSVVNLSIDAMVRTNPNALSIVVTFLRLTLLDGALLDIRGSSVVSTGGGGGVLPAVSIMIKNLTGLNGALVIRGAFPPGTSMLISAANMTTTAASHRVAAPALFFFSNLTLVSSSSIVVSSCAFVVSSDASRDVSSIAFSDSISVSKMSRIVVTASSFDSVTARLDDASVVQFDQARGVAISESSELIFSFCRWRTSTSCFSTNASCIMSVTFSSSWTFVECDISSVGDTMKILGSFVTISDGSSLTISNCNISSGTGRAFSVFSARIVVTTKSSWSFLDTSFLSSHRSLGIDDSIITVTDFCGLRFARLQFSNGTGFSGCSVVLNLSSEWSFVDVSGISMHFAYGSTTVASNSSFLFLRCLLVDDQQALYFQRLAIDIADGSSWRIALCSLQGASIGGFSFFGLAVDVRNESMWTISSSIIRSSSGLGAMLVMATISNKSEPHAIRISQKSSWIIDACTITAGANSGGIAFLGIDITITNGSVWNLSDSAVSTADGTGIVFSLQQQTKLSVVHSSGFLMCRNTLRASTVSATSSVMLVAVGSSVVVSDMSLWMISNGSLAGPRGALTTTADSLVRLEGASAWVVTGVTMIVTAGATKAAVLLSSGMSVVGSSAFVVSENRVQVASSGASAACLNIGRLALGSFGNVRITENNCSVSGSASAVLLVGGWSSATRDGALVERCNVMNGGRWSPDVLLLDFVSLPCGQCDNRVDCFWPLIEPRRFPKMRCGDQCRCMNGCGSDAGGGACLPGPEVDARTCMPHLMDSGRFGATRTATLNETITAETFTHTLTLEGIEVGKSASRSSGPDALHASVVAAVSAAVVLYGPCGAAMMQRMAAQQTINSCTLDLGGGADFSSSPTQMHFGPSAAGMTSRNAPYIRGAVLGNMLLWVACAAVAAMLCVALVQRGITNEVKESVTLLGLPGRMYGPFSMLVIPTLTAVTTLMAGGGVIPGDMVLGIIGLAVCITPMAIIALTTIGPRFMAVAVPSAGAARQRTSTDAQIRRSGEWVRKLVTSPVEWVNRRRRSAAGFVERHGLLFMAYVPNRQWFCTVELAAGSASGVTAGLVFLDSGDGAVCERLQVISTMAAVSFMLGVAILRPYGTPADMHLALANAAVTATSSVFGACGVDTTLLTTVQAYLNAISALLIVAALATEGYFTAAWRRGREVFFGVAGSTRHSTTSGAQWVAGDSQQQIGRSAKDRARALENIVNLICSRPRDNRQDSESLL